MEIKEFTDLIQAAVDELHKATERQDAEIKSHGEVAAETKASVDKINERIDEITAQRDELEVKVQRMALPGTDPDKGEKTEVQVARKDAFYKYIRQGVDALNPDEQKALVEDSTGQYLIEPELDTEIVMALPKLVVMRGLATIRPVGKDRLKIKSMGAVTTGWGKLETGGDVHESSPIPGEPTYQYVEDLQALAKIGKDELADSDINLEPILAELFSVGFAEAEDLAFFRGAGHDSEQPEGVCISSTLTGNTVTSTAAGAVTFEKFMEMVYQCPTQYRKNGVFVVNSTTELLLRQLRSQTSATYRGPFLWQPSLEAGKPPTFLGYPIHTQDDIKSLATSAGQVFAIFGDFKQGYRIIDRAGMFVQRLTELYAEAGLVGFLITKRVSGAVTRASQQPLVLQTET